MSRNNAAVANDSAHALRNCADQLRGTRCVAVHAAVCPSLNKLCCRLDIYVACHYASCSSRPF